MKKRFKLPNLIRAILLLGIAAIWLILYYYTDIFQYFSKDKISTAIEAVREFVDHFGIFGPILFVVAGSLALLINFHAVPIVCLSVVTFGRITGAIISFVIVC